MNLNELAEKAIGLREKFAERELKEIGRPWTNVELAAAFSADLGQLSKAIMVKEGLRNDPGYTDEKLTHHLADLFWAVLVIAKKYDVDLEKALMDMIEETEAKLSES